MKTRLNLLEKGHNILKPLQSMVAYLSKGKIEESLLNLIYYRVSQINGCAFCLDMHSKELMAKGEKDQRLFMISAWRESDIYSMRERAALAYAENLTILPNNQVSDEVYGEAAKNFSEEEIIDLTLGILAINNFNRINISFRTPAGNYVVGQKEALIQ